MDDKNKLKLILKKLKKIEQIANELKNGRDVTKNRIITIKNIFDNPYSAMHFSVYFSKNAFQEIEKKQCPDYLDIKIWNNYKKLLSDGIDAMEKFINIQKIESIYLIRELLYQLDKYEKKYIHKWISSASIIKYALRCILLPFDSSYYAYQIAREYIEKDAPYNPIFLPKSIQSLNEIIEYLCKYYFNKTPKVLLNYKKKH